MLGLKKGSGFYPLFELRRCTVSIMMILALFMADTSRAEKWEYKGVGEDRFRVELGVFITQFNTDLQVNSKGFGLGTKLNLEDDLGLSSSSRVFRTDGYFRIAKRHRIEFAFFDFNRNASALLKRDIQFGNVFFPAGSGVISSFDLVTYKAGYMYSFVQADNLEIAASVGIHLLDLTAAVQTTGGRLQAEASAIAPLPVIGLTLEYSPIPRFHASIKGQWFALRAGDFKGVLQDYRVRFEYFFLKNTAIGIGYNYYNIGVTANKPKFIGRLDWRYSGLQLFGTFRF